MTDLHDAQRDKSFLYDLQADPHEEVDVAGEHPLARRSLEGQLASWRAALAPPPDLDHVPTPEDITEELKSLGYVR